MTNDKFLVDVSPEMQLYKILQRQSYDIGTALAEFVDNSVQSFVDKNKAIKSIDGQDATLKVRIEVDTKGNSIVIKDNAGGINRADFQRAIRMGREKGFNPDSGSLAVYGIGMKSSAIWFSNKWSVETSALGSKEKLVATFDLDQLLESGNTHIEVSSHPEKENEHYTKIIIGECLRTLELSEEYFKDSVLPFLRETFFKFDGVYIELEHDNLILQTRKAFIKTPSPLEYPEVDRDGNKLSDKSVVWRRNLDFKHDGKRIRGFVMIMERGGYHSPGIRLLRNRRVVLGTQGGNRQNKPNVLLGTSNKYAAQRIYGELTLNECPVNFMKSGFDENMDSIYRAVRSKLIARPPDVEEDLIRQATHFRRGKVEPTSKSKTKKKPGKPSGKKSPKSTPKIEDNILFSTELNDTLAQLNNHKLHRLYESLCRVSLINDPVLAYVAAWTLLESLATLLGKGPNTAFDSFYNGKINLFTQNKTERGDYRIPIGDIHEKGNMNKHSSKYETINAQQLVSDFQSIDLFLIHCAELAVKSES